MPAEAKGWLPAASGARPGPLSLPVRAVRTEPHRATLRCLASRTPTAAAGGVAWLHTGQPGLPERWWSWFQDVNRKPKERWGRGQGAQEGGHIPKSDAVAWFQLVSPLSGV